MKESVYFDRYYGDECLCITSELSDPLSSTTYILLFQRKVVNGPPLLVTQNCDQIISVLLNYFSHFSLGDQRPFFTSAA